MLENIWTAFLAGVALVWTVQLTRGFRGVRHTPRLGEVPPLVDAECPSVSVLFAARDEAAKLPAALATMIAQDYRDYEVIAVNDRSRDATPQILETFASRGGRLKVLHIRDLPPGWLGKPHALARAYEASRGDWLVFTDADVRFAPDVLRRALALVQQQGWDHLTLVGLLDLEGFWETTTTLYFAVGFLFGVEPWQVSNPKSRRYMGVGSFQLLRRSSHEAIGTHRRLAMEVVDDMKLGKLVKLAGFRSGVAEAGERIRLRWNEGLREIVRNVEKNFFAAQDFKVGRVLASVAGILALSVAPFLGLFLGQAPARIFAALAAALAVAGHVWSASRSRISPLYGLTHPLGALIFCYMLLRSMTVTLLRGGIVWRDTFYSLEELRKGRV